MRKEDEMQDGKLSGAMRIFEALSSVDEELLMRSEESKKVIPFWRYAKVMAACICFAVVGVAAYTSIDWKSAKENASADCAAPAAMEEAAVEETAAEVAPEEGAETEYATSGSNYESQKSDSDVADNGMIMDCGPLPEASVVLSSEELKLVDTLGAYIPAEVPVGYGFAEGMQSAEGDSISACWENGMDTISISVSYYERSVENVARIIDISKPETYDVHLYEIPYAETVPDEYRSVFNNPIFRAEDLSLEVIAARMKSVSDMGDTNTPRGHFEVLYDGGVLVSFSGRGDAESIWQMFESVER